MADIYLQKIRDLSGVYLRVYGVKNVKPEERAGLNLILAEYIAMTGDISGDPQRSVGMRNLRRMMMEEGHKLHIS